jgi:hypothetical protein
LFQIFATGVDDTGGKFTAIETGGKFATGINGTSTTSWQNLPPVSLLSVANLPLVPLTSMVHLDLRISLHI